MPKPWSIVQLVRDLDQRPDLYRSSNSNLDAQLICFLSVECYSSRGGPSSPPASPKSTHSPQIQHGGQNALQSAGDFTEGSGEEDQIEAGYNVVDGENSKEGGVKQIVVQLPAQLRGLHLPHTPKGMTFEL